MNYKKTRNRFVLLIASLICLAMIVECVILDQTNQKQISKTSQILLDQVENILESNEQEEQAIREELEDEYVEKAYAVSYILKDKEELLDEVNELRKIAEMMSIDEINFFNAQGILDRGTNPEYFGLSMDDGEQVGFFKPMLEDTNLSMCQDATLNTAAQKKMIYATIWDSSKEYIIQVGIEPVRLLEEEKNNSIYEVIKQMPVYEGLNICVANISSGVIIGSADRDLIGKTVYDYGILNQNDDIQTIAKKTVHLNGYKNYCFFKQYEQYIIAISHSTSANVRSFLVTILIELAGLLLAGAIILFILLKLVKASEQIKNQMSVLSSIADIYYSMHLIDLNDYAIETLESNDRMDKVVKEGNHAGDILERIVKETIEEEYMESALAFVDVTTLKERMQDKRFIAMDALNKNVGWLRITFITVEDAENKPTKVIIATQVIDEDKKREEELSIKANRDEMTGLLNRRAYEDDLLEYPDIPTEANFVYAAIDVNGLKVVNDELGHAAGDELITGAAQCLKRTFGNYGRVYRTGGDEFVSMFFADEQTLQAVIDDLERVTIAWEGRLVPNLTMSVGYATKREFENDTVEEMAKIADQRMYKAKSEYYSKKGIDRRGQAAAHTALCKLYTKILKINLTDDTYQIVNMDMNEQTTDKGFSYKISEWLSSFGKTGQVHEDDLQDYLKATDLQTIRDYFTTDKTSYHVFYRRKYGDVYKQVMMELIPADDYSDEQQTLYLYVKEIDK